MMATIQATPERAALATAGQIMRPPSRAGSSAVAPASPQPPGAAPAAGAGAPPASELTLENISIDKLAAGDARNLLQKSLGKDKYDQYWALLRKFLMCRLSKPEYDAALKRLLGAKELMNLHNMFLLSILKSAFAAAGTKKAAKVPTRNLFPKPVPYHRRHPSDPSVQGREMLEYNALLGRMNKAAKNHGLAHVDGSCAQLMLAALERYLTRVVCAVKPDIRLQPDIGDMLLPHQEQILTSVPGDISGPDVARALSRRPTLLSDNQALLMQRFDMDIE